MGSEFAAALRENTEWREIPVVVHTSKDLTAPEREWLQGHVQKVVQKGEFQRDDLLREIRNCVSRWAVRAPDDSTASSPSTSDI